MNRDAGRIEYPLPISRALVATEQACFTGEPDACHATALRLADAVAYYLGALAVAQYWQGQYDGAAEADPALNRSLRSLRRVLPGQWLGWTARALAATPDGPVQGMAAWYTHEQEGEVAAAYADLLRTMVDELGYTGDYGPRETASPRHLLELIDQYRIRRRKVLGDAQAESDGQVGERLLAGLRALLESAQFLMEYQLYAPNQRQMLMGQKAVTPMPPITPPTDMEASLLLYPPGEMPDYTKRPNLQAERLPLFPLDPLLVYVRCAQCDQYRVSALQEVVQSHPATWACDPIAGTASVSRLAG